MSGRTSPQQGDIVVTQETRAHVHYMVHQLGGSVRFGATMREDAVRLAVGFGQARAVDVWYGEAESYWLLESGRARTSMEAAREATDY
jgi:hypothetical protein